MTDFEQIRKLKTILETTQRITVFTGAGTSTESGVKDYRSADGIYNACTQYGMRPEDILHHDSLSQCPDIFWDFIRTYFLTAAEPNAFHFWLKELEKEGKLLAVITQNVDDLFEQVGLHNVIHIHGTAQQYYCMNCAKRYTKGDILQMKDTVPRCKDCGVMIRPRICLYGECPEEDAAQSAIDAIETADTLIVAGTSLRVYPAASYLRFFGGENLVIFNREETDYDARATLAMHDSIGEILNALKTV